MSNLEQLTLNIHIQNRTTFVDGTQINNQILIHTQHLHKFDFHIHTAKQGYYGIDSILSEVILHLENCALSMTNRSQIVF